MDSQTLTFGLVGHGLWGAHHARAIHKTAGARLAAVADRAADNLAAAQAAYPHAATTADWRALVARPDIDVVDVAVPSHLHYEIGRAVLESGKHLFLEKPMVLSVAHANELVQLAREQGKLLAVDHEMRLSALWGRVKQLLRDGVVGVPQYVLIELSRFPYRQGSDGWRYDIRRVGNWILEEPIHFFDLARWYMEDFGEPLSVFARANSRQADRPELQDNFTTILDFSHGGFAVITQTLAAFEHHVTCKISGSEGALWAYWSGADARTPRPTFGLKYARAAAGTQVGGETVEELPFEQATGEIVELELQIASIVRAVRHGTPPAASGDDGRWSVRLCLAAQRSVDERRGVRIEEIV